MLTDNFHKKNLNEKGINIKTKYIVGNKILERNFRCKIGEIDIIALHKGYLVFIEVKYRKDSAAGHPLEAVDYQKQNKIRYTAQYYMYKNRIPENTPCRFDVVSILGDEITLIKDAF